MTTRPAKPIAETELSGGLRSGTSSADVCGDGSEGSGVASLAEQGNPGAGELSLVLRPRRRRLLRLLLMSVALSSAGFLGGGAAGTIPGALFALFSVAFGVAMLPGATFLRIERGGFTYRSFFRSRTFTWDDVDGFGPTMVSGVEIVGFHSRRARRENPFATATSAALSGYGSALPDTYGLDARELAALLNEAWARARPGGQP